MRILLLGIGAGLLWLGIAETAQAQRYRGGWAGVVNQFANPGNYIQGYGNYNNRYGSGYNNGFYGNLYSNGYYGNGYNTGNYYDSGYRYSNTPTYSYYPSQQATQPAVRQVPQGEAWIRVILPDPNAELLFNGVKTSEIGRERTFARNTHEAGDRNSYRYTASASWTQGGQQMTDARTVVARPGEIVVVDFTQPAPPVRLGSNIR